MLSCSLATNPSAVISEKATLGCSGGEYDTEGLFIIDGKITKEQIANDSTVTGRETSGLIGKVTEYKVQDNLVFIELLVIRDHQEFGDVINNVTANRKLPIDIRLTEPQTYKNGNISYEIKPDFKFNPSLRLTFQNDVVKFSQLDVVYEGTVEAGIHMKIKAGDRFDYVNENQFVDKRRIGSYYVTLGNVPIPLSGYIQVKYSVSVDLPASLETTFGVTSSGYISFGSGLRPQEDRLVILPPTVANANTSSTRAVYATQLEEKNITISVNATLTPTIVFTFPSEPVAPFCTTKSTLPDWLANFVGINETRCAWNSEEETSSAFQFSTTFDIQTNYTILMCDDVCNQNNSLPCDIPNADILYGGLTNMNMLTTYNQVDLTQIAQIKNE
ncbi:uncharacterized protein [Antedon mediterranea]|uniref:uncharacterized protein n=1 Tax=Antedon mediterranea TaxID=105859 RepID=UPI003AF7BC38